MVFRRGAQDGGNQFWEVPWDPVYCPSIEQLWKWDPRLAWRLFYWSTMGCAAGLWSPGIHQWQAADPGACHALISFPDPSVRCCTGKYTSTWKRMWNTSRPNQSWWDRMKINAAIAQTCYATLAGMKTSLHQKHLQWHCHCSDTNGFLFVHTYSCLDSFCISAL